MSDLLVSVDRQTLELPAVIKGVVKSVNGATPDSAGDVTVEAGGEVTDAAVADAIGPETTTALAPVIDARTGNGQRPVGRGELMLNVMDFGATGDGVTDDSASIQAAIDSLGPTGGRVYLPPGRYLIGGNAIKPTNNVMLFGAGLSTVLVKKANALNPLVQVIGASAPVYGVSIKSLAIDGNKANHTTDDPEGSAPSVRYGIVSTDSHDLTVEGVLIHDTVNSGMYLDGSKVRVLNCTVRNIGKSNGIGRSGIVIAAEGTGSTNGPPDYIPYSQGALVQGCLVDNVGEHGIKLYPDCHGGKVIGNTIEGAATFGVYIQDSHNVSVTGNTVKGAGNSGIMIGEGGGESNSCTVNGNTVRECVNHGFLVQYSKGAVFSGNTSVDNGITGFALVGGSSAVINSNVSARNGYNGILLSEASNDSVISNNICHDNGSAWADGAGIFSWDNFDNTSRSLRIAVTGNRFFDSGSGHQKYGIRTTDQANFWLVTGNVLVSNVTSPTSMVGANNVVANNIIP